MSRPVIVGRSSSHFTRVPRVFAFELGIDHEFRPIFDLTSADPSSYADNPALKIPVLVDEHGRLFGSENICSELVRRSGKRDLVVLRGDVVDRAVANAEELTLHVMAADVTLIMAKFAGHPDAVPTKVARSIEDSLRYLDASVDALLLALPPTRLISFVEVALYCVLTHLPFREVMDVSAYQRLGQFCTGFAQRESARLTRYEFDVPPENLSST
jgi:glutathione S-transferase